MRNFGCILTSIFIFSSLLGCTAGFQDQGSSSLSSFMEGLLTEDSTFLWAQARVTSPGAVGYVCFGAGLNTTDPTGGCFMSASWANNVGGTAQGYVIDANEILAFGQLGVNQAFAFEMGDGTNAFTLNTMNQNTLNFGFPM